MFLEKLKLAEVKTMNNKNSRLNINNHQPISLLSNISNVLKKYIIFDQVTDCLESNKFFCESQLGFRKNMSTKLALSKFVNQTLEALDGSNKLNSWCFL